MKTQEEKLLEEMGSIHVMAKGKVTPIRTAKNGRTYYSLQARRDGRNVTRYVPEGKVETVRAATVAYKRFMGLVERYVELCETRLDL